MNRDTINALVAYDDWANDRLLEALHSLSAEEFERPLSGSFHSLRATWANLVMAEWLWFWRWQGKPPAVVPAWVAEASREQLKDTLLEVGRQRREALAPLSDADLARRATYTNLAGDKSWELSVGQLLTHVVNHSTYHHGQIATLLRQLGRQGPSTDFVLFTAEASPAI